MAVILVKNSVTFNNDCYVDGKKFLQSALKQYTNYFAIWAVLEGGEGGSPRALALTP